MANSGHPSFRHPLGSLHLYTTPPPSFHLLLAMQEVCMPPLYTSPGGLRGYKHWPRISLRNKCEVKTMVGDKQGTQRYRFGMWMLTVRSAQDSLLSHFWVTLIHVVVQLGARAHLNHQHPPQGAYGANPQKTLRMGSSLRWFFVCHAL